MMMFLLQLMYNHLRLSTLQMDHLRMMIILTHVLKNAQKNVWINLQIDLQKKSKVEKKTKHEIDYWKSFLGQLGGKISIH